MYDSHVAVPVAHNPGVVSVTLSPLLLKSYWIDHDTAPHTALIGESTTVIVAGS